MNLNQATIAGNITRKPELKALPSGTKVATFSIATNEYYKDQNGQQQQKVTYHNIKVWGVQAENCAKYLVKGQQVLVAGKIENTTYEGKDGTTKYRSEIVARTVQFGSRPKGAEKPDAGMTDEEADRQMDELAGTTEAEAPQTDPKPELPTVEYPDDEINPEDIPF